MKRVRVAADTRSGEGIHRGSITSQRILFRLEGREAALDVVRKRSRMVERASVQPDALGPQAPGCFDRDSEQVLAEPPAGELVEQPEVRDLDSTLLVAFEL